MQFVIYPEQFFLHLKRTRLEICQKTKVTGNPLAYYRTTQKLKYTDEIRRYEEWKDWVFDQMKKQAPGGKIPRAADGEKFFLGMMISFQRHSLADRTKKVGNFSTIEERFYKTDRQACGCFDYDYDPGNPRVEIEIFPVREKEKITMELEPWHDKSAGKKSPCKKK